MAKKQHLREVLLGHYFNKVNATEAHRLLVKVYGYDALSERQCREWFQRFKNRDFDIKDKERPGQPKRFEDAELVALLDEDPCQTQEELAISLKVTHQAISKRLKALGMIQKQGSWVPYELKPRDVERRLLASEMHLERHERKSFCIVS